MADLLQVWVILSPHEQSNGSSLLCGICKARQVREAYHSFMTLSTDWRWVVTVVMLLVVKFLAGSQPFYLSPSRAAYRSCYIGMFF